MIVRRVLLVASMVVLLSGAPAYAQSYGDVPAGNRGQGGGGGAGPGDPPPFRLQAAQTGSATPAGGDLPRTGQSNVVPMIQVAIVLMGAGTLLVLVTRRRHTSTRVPAV